MECVTIGQLNADGPCTLFTKVNDNGIVLFECSDVLYTPATCPDAPTDGTFAVGPAVVKIASVDGTVANTLVQRDVNRGAFAEVFGIDAIPCDHLGSRMLERIVAVGNGDINLDVGVGAVASTLRLRGNGDLWNNGGSYSEASLMGGFAEIRRKGSQEGIVEYSNFAGPADTMSLGHLFMVEQTFGGVSTNLMRLTPFGGTLYFPIWNYVSDMRLKSDIVPLNGKLALDVVMGIEPISYIFRDKRYHGFSAQNVGKVLPDAVSEPDTKDDPMTMRDGDILANLVAAVKFLTARVEALEAKVGA